MIRKVGYQWHLRQLMAQREMFATSDLVPKLAERGITLSREQVFRLVTQVPQRLSLDTLAALCDILECQVADLIEVTAEQVAERRRAGEAPLLRAAAPSAPRRAVVRRPDLS
ncbi:helix-turn-helix domain-containing protein [Kitasatospora kifunensis]|uniref:DNA-binding Xre family transcriptional regulator n=1 Tax=Kitasatospora kifunensis TaxID=58351 RepID=A0A7W7VYZ8_KITKI|nr:helix-turn-helix transcriptional regulator [Kitasatospora kifunensis]MBB4928257.1 DNA-binding Xre family transcriptional regulator [Kitasatospora kifunensis]